jgi:hypothetical protein
LHEVAGEELKFGIGIPVETNADQAADSVEGLRDQILSGTESIRAMNATLKLLRGSSDEVTAAKAKLKAQVTATQDRISASTLALVKEGTSFDAVAQKAKRFAEEQKKLAEQVKKDEAAKAKERTTSLTAAISQAGGPVASLRDKFAALKSITGESSAAMGLVTLAAAGTIAVVAALSAAVVAASISLGKFILTSANAARSANLAREAWSNKVPTSKAALNELAISLMKSKLGGQATVDTFNAVAQASAALGDEAGGKIKDFIERSRMIGRVRIDPREMLEGFGNLNFDDVARSLADGMHVSVAAASKALREGRVKLGDGAKAMKDAVEKKFGDLNLRKMLDLNVMSEKLDEKLAHLTDGVKLDALLKPMGELGKLFDESTVTGAQLKSLVTAFGTGMVTELTKAIPLIKATFEGLVIGSLHAYIGFLKLRNQFQKTFGPDTLKNVDLLGDALWAAEQPGIALGNALEKVAAAMKVVDKAVHGDFSGSAIVKGILAGINGGGTDVELATKLLAVKAKDGFKNELEIHSPSKAFFRYGKALPEGAAGGVEDGSPKAQAAVADMIDVPSSPRGGSSSSARGGSPVVNVHLHVDGAGAGVAKQIEESGILKQLTKAVLDALLGAGIPAS